MNTTIDQANFFRMLTEKSGSGILRGDYSQADAEYRILQDWHAYTPAQHALWRKLYQRQAQLLPGRACDTFIDCLAKLDAADAIPNLERVSTALYQTTAWRLVAVPGLIPEETFFRHLANRCFPVTVWLRQPHEFDYIVEPDVFHDFFGHVPLLFNSVFADYLQEFGNKGLQALNADALPLLARLYWYTVEFGLIDTPQGLRAYGAGILSSGGEIQYCLTDSSPRRVPLNIERVMRTLYRIDAYQETYFVIQSFQELFDNLSRDFNSIYPRLKLLPPLSASALLPEETDIGSCLSTASGARTEAQASLFRADVSH